MQRGSQAKCPPRIRLCSPPVSLPTIMAFPERICCGTLPALNYKLRRLLSLRLEKIGEGAVFLRRSRVKSDGRQSDGAGALKCRCNREAYAGWTGRVALSVSTRSLWGPNTGTQDGTAAREMTFGRSGPLECWMCWVGGLIRQYFVSRGSFRLTADRESPFGGSDTPWSPDVGEVTLAWS